MSEPSLTDNRVQVASRQIVCPECRESFVPIGFTVRPVEGQPSLKNMGLGCPHCGWFGHLFVEDARMRRYRDKLLKCRRLWERERSDGRWARMERAKSSWLRVFDEVQAKWRPALGLTPIEPADEAAVGPEATQ